MPECCTVVSFVPYLITETKPGLFPSYFKIEPSDTRTPQLLEVTDGFHFIYIDAERGSVRIKDTAEDIATSIVNDYRDAQIGLDKDNPEIGPAIFYLNGTKTVEDVLKDKERVSKALENQVGWFYNICRLADRDYKKYRSLSVISEFQRIAARHLGLKESDYEWLMLDKNTQDVTCPACKSRVSPGAIVCKTCQCILDPEKYKTLQFAKGA